MQDDPTSLNRLHDLSMPPEIPWWPPAPGWYFLLMVLFALLGYFAWKSWRIWQGNAWRREALASLQSATNATAVAVILRRCGLVVEPRDDVAALSGNAWIDWLSEHSVVVLEDEVRDQLIYGVYGPSGPADHSQFQTLKEFAESWIRNLSIRKMVS